MRCKGEMKQEEAQVETGRNQQRVSGRKMVNSGYWTDQ